MARKRKAAMTERELTEFLVAGMRADIAAGAVAWDAMVKQTAARLRGVSPDA
jgi:hypothetical protein